MLRSLSRKAVSLTYVCKLLQHGGPEAVKRTLTDIEKINHKIKSNPKFQVIKYIMDHYVDQCPASVRLITTVFQLLRETKWIVKKWQMRRYVRDIRDLLIRS
jgi:hypothetical protein